MGIMTNWLAEFGNRLETGPLSVLAAAILVAFALALYRPHRLLEWCRRLHDERAGLAADMILISFAYTLAVGCFVRVSEAHLVLLDPYFRDYGLAVYEDSIFGSFLRDWVLGILVSWPLLLSLLACQLPLSSDRRFAAFWSLLIITTIVSVSLHGGMTLAESEEQTALWSGPGKAFGSLVSREATLHRIMIFPLLAVLGIIMARIHTRHPIVALAGIAGGAVIALTVVSLGAIAAWQLGPNPVLLLIVGLAIFPGTLLLIPRTLDRSAPAFGVSPVSDSEQPSRAKLSAPHLAWTAFVGGILIVGNAQISLSQVHQAQLAEWRRNNPPLAVLSATAPLRNAADIIRAHYNDPLREWPEFPPGPMDLAIKHGYTRSIPVNGAASPSSRSVTFHNRQPLDEIRKAATPAKRQEFEAELLERSADLILLHRLLEADYFDADAGRGLDRVESFHTLLMLSFVRHRMTLACLDGDVDQSIADLRLLLLIAQIPGITGLKHDFPHVDSPVELAVEAAHVYWAGLRQDRQAMRFLGDLLDQSRHAMRRAWIIPKPVPARQPMPTSMRFSTSHGRSVGSLYGWIQPLTAKGLTDFEGLRIATALEEHRLDDGAYPDVLAGLRTLRPAMDLQRAPGGSPWCYVVTPECFFLGESAPADQQPARRIRLLPWRDYRDKPASVVIKCLPEPTDFVLNPFASSSL